MAAVHGLGGTIGGAVFGSAGPLAARTTYGVTGRKNSHFEYKKCGKVISYVAIFRCLSK